MVPSSSAGPRPDAARPAADALELSVLGPLRVAVEGIPVELGRRVGALLLLLTLRDGAVIPTDQLIDRLWPQEPPSDARNALQALVSRTRRALGPAGAAITTRGGGYALELEAVTVDAYRLDEAVVAARSAIGAGDGAGGGEVGRDVADVAARLDAALASWRGDPYVEVANDPDAIAAATRLQERRLEAVELRAELAFELGDSDARVAELRVVAAAHPTRERLHRTLAESLYRAGRQTEALAVLERLIGRLRDDLGLDPAPPTAALQQALLQHDQHLTAAPPRRRKAQPQPLPQARTSFVGRDEECVGIRDALRTSQLVTLIGPGGSGKTRIAVEVARGLAADEVAYVELAALTDPDDVLSQLAGGLGLDLGASATVGREPIPVRSLEERIVGHLRDQRLLIVLDNCEHLIDAAAAAVELALEASPQVRVLATSREGLRVPGEVLWAVPPLTVPAPEDDATSGDAVALFVDRARAVDMGFQLDERTVPAVREICRRLDGLPLAIELAAARIATLPVTVLAERLGDRFRLLTGGRRAVRRQETLEAVVAWSHDLLDERQRLLFLRLGAFAGPVPVPLVEAVVADDRLPIPDVLPVLAELADRSLVVIDDISPLGQGPSPRVHMLETIRTFARQHLLASGDAEQVHARHAAAMADLAARAGVGVRGPDQLAWLDRLDAELDEYRTALSWAIDTDPATAVAIAAELGWYWWLHDHRTEAVRVLERALERGAEVASPASTATAWAWLGFLLTFDNRFVAAEAASEQAAAALEQLGPDAPGFVRAGVPVIVGYVQTLCSGQLEVGMERLRTAVAQAERLEEHWVLAAGRYVLAAFADVIDPSSVQPEAERALVAARRAGDRWAEFQTRVLLGSVAVRLADYATARSHLDLAITLGEQIGTREQVRATRVQRAVADMLAGDLAVARQCLDELLRSPRIHPRDFSESIAYTALGMLLRRTGDLDGAADAYRRARDGFHAEDAHLAAAEALAGLVYVEVARGDVGASRALLAEAVGEMEASPWPLGRTLPFLLEAAAAVALAADDATLAGWRLGRAAALRVAHGGGELRGGERFDVDRLLAAVQAALGPRADAVVREGRDRTGLLPPLD